MIAALIKEAFGQITVLQERPDLERYPRIPIYFCANHDAYPAELNEIQLIWRFEL